MIRCMNVDEARGVCKDRSRWRSVVSAYTRGKKKHEFMYVYIYVNETGIKLDQPVA